jgi:hypothetical protein
LRATAAILAIVAAVVTGCGADGDYSSELEPKTADTPRSRVAVIKSWADSLRRGQVERASLLFSVPAIVENGTPPILLDTRREVRAFNATLPCGARLLRTFSHERYVTAEFRLTERPGKGRCGDGTGQKARVTIVVLDNRIVEWRRVSTRPALNAPIV